MNALEELEQKNNELTKSSVIFTRWLSSISNLEEVINSSPYILEHGFYLKEIVSKSKYMLGENEEEVIAKMKSTGSRAWQRFYMEITSTTLVDVDINGEMQRLSFGEVKNMLYDKDLTLRKIAYNAERKACKDISQAVCACINGISGEALTICDMKGYESPINKVLSEFRMDKETLNAMMSAIKDRLPMLHKYYRKKGEMIGHKFAIPFYDVYASIGTSNGKLSYEEAKNLIISSFKTFSKELSNFAKRAFDEDWIDAEPRAGKGNYGLSVDIFPIKESRIMTNFSGNYIDVIILAHEIGHTYHSYCLRDEQMLNVEYPTPIAETASIFCETIMNNELIKMVPDEEKTVILERSISDAAYYIVEMYGRFLFECEVFQRRKEGPLSVDELNEIMKKSIKEAYGETIDEESINPYSWANNIGFYMAGNEFLNFSYAFGVLFSKGLFAEYVRKGSDFVVAYEMLLKNTSKNNIVDIAKFMNIDVHSVDFWQGALRIIEMDINKLV